MVVCPNAGAGEEPKAEALAGDAPGVVDPNEDEPNAGFDGVEPNAVDAAEPPKAVAPKAGVFDGVVEPKAVEAGVVDPKAGVEDGVVEPKAEAPNAGGLAGVASEAPLELIALLSKEPNAAAGFAGVVEPNALWPNEV